MAMACGVLAIVRESLGLLCCGSLLPTFLLIALLLLFPFSSISLSQSLTVSRLAAGYGDLCSRLLPAPLAHLLHLQISQALLAQAICFPVVLTLCTLARAAVLYILACRERGKQASLMGLLDVVPQAWCRMAATYMWGCILVMAITAAMAFLDVAGAMAVRTISGAGSSAAMTGLQSSALIAMEIAAALICAVLLAPMAVVLNLSTVVAGMEEGRWGMQALLRALALLKHGRLQPSLLLFLISSFSIAAVDGIFQCRVLGRVALPAAPPSTTLLEAPLLIFAHSFLLLFDTILTAVFYRACHYAEELSPCICSGKLKCEDDDDDDHFSIVIHIMERQCRKVFTCSQTLS